VSTGIAVTRAMTAREFLDTPQGVALRNGPSARFLGPIGDVLDLVDFIRDITGGGPGMDIDDLLDNRELLEQILKSQGDILDGIGGIGDQIGGIGEDISTIEDLLGQIEEGNEEARAQLERILAEQRRQTAAINKSLAAINNSIQGMWSDMNTWFAVTLAAIADLADAVAEIQQQLQVIEALLHEVLAEVAELHDRVDWSAIISMFAEHEHRVGYAIEKMMEVTVQVTDGAANSDGPALTVDTAELDAWARMAATDDYNGLAFSLFALHRVLVGDTAMGKSLMLVFCKLLRHNQDVHYREAAGYFLRLAALQAQGFAALIKARQAIGLPETDYASLLEQRLVAQAGAVSDALEAGFGVTQWNDAVHREGWGDVPIPHGDPTPRDEYVFAVGSNRELLVGMSFVADPGPPINVGTDFYVGQALPGTRKVNPATVKTVHGGQGEGSFVVDYLTTTYAEDPVSGEEHGYFTYHAQHFVFDPPYVMVGLRMALVDGVTRFEPLVAEYDEKAGTTSWNGTSGGLWKATLDETCQPTVIDLGPRADTPMWNQKMAITFPKGEYKVPEPTAIIGFRLSRRYSGGKTWLVPGLLNPYWEQETRLPSLPPSTYLRYDPFTLP
jgi:hypothetical protein